MPDLPENIKGAHEEPEEFTLDDGSGCESPIKQGIAFADESDEWKKIDEKERRDKEEAGSLLA